MIIRLRKGLLVVASVSLVLIVTFCLSGRFEDPIRRSDRSTELPVLPVGDYSNENATPYMLRTKAGRRDETSQESSLTRPSLPDSESALPLSRASSASVEANALPEPKAFPANNPALSSPATTTPLSVILTQQQNLTDTLRGIVKHPAECALMFYPVAANVGDSVLTYGAMKLADAVGLNITLMVSRHIWLGIPLEDKQRYLGNRILLLNGGGNMGQLWSFQPYYTRLIDQFPNNTIIHMPQSIAITDDAKFMREHGIVYERHAHLYLLLRDQFSYDTATRLFPTLHARQRIFLTSDTAFALGPLTLPVPYRSAAKPIVWLDRQDRESNSNMSVSAERFCKSLRLCEQLVFGPCDWVRPMPRVPEPPDARLSKYLAHSYSAFATLRDAPLLTQTKLRILQEYFRTEMERGLATIALGHVALCNRLHCQILSVLARRPVVVIPSKTQKDTHYYDTWHFHLNSSSLVLQRNGNVTEAMQRAYQLYKDDGGIERI